jgi:hypothetical protein
MKQIKVKKGNRELVVPEKAYAAVYSAFGYRKVSGVVDKATDTPRIDDSKSTNTETVNLFDLSEAELKKVKKDDIKAFLEKEHIEYEADAYKSDLIEIILKDSR